MQRTTPRLLAAGAIGLALVGVMGLGVWVYSGAVRASSAETPGLRIGGAADVTPLMDNAGAVYSATAQIPLRTQASRAPLEALRAGQADAVLMGRELTAAEREGLIDWVIAYDAVCVDMDAQTVLGGMQVNSVKIGGLTVPQMKFGGVKQITLDQLKAEYAWVMKLTPDAPIWPAYSFQAYTVDLGNPNAAMKPDPKNPGYAAGSWVWEPQTLGARTDMASAGLFDTQSVLLQALGVPEATLANPKIPTTSLNVTSEAEWVTFRFKVLRRTLTSESNDPFQFSLAALSRRITLWALDDNFGIRAVPIDGIDPTGDPGPIYSGAYPLSRKIHLLARAPASTAVDTLAQWLLSPAGQKLVAEAGYLPLPPAP